MTSLRPASLVDIRQVSDLSRRMIPQDYGFYPQPVQNLIVRRYSGRAMAAAILRGGREVTVAHDGPRIRGFLVSTPYHDSVAVVNWLLVDKPFRQQGIARLLLDDFEKRLAGAGVHKIMLWTEIAPGYYAKLGWQQEARLPNHWWGQDFFIMAKYI